MVAGEAQGEAYLEVLALLLENLLPKVDSTIARGLRADVAATPLHAAAQQHDSRTRAGAKYVSVHAQNL